MARGITELDVHQAADDLIVSGERPTVERIRAHLGTGSPNTVTRHLDSWWSTVGVRLRRHAIEEGRPQVPATVSTLAQRCWNAALEAAGEHAQAALAGERAALEAMRAEWAGQCQAHAHEQVQTQQRLTEVAEQARTHQSAAAALREQLQQLTAQAADLQRQRDGALARSERLDQQLAGLTARLEAQDHRHEQERGELRAHIRATEEHALLEVDRARQAVIRHERAGSATQAQHDSDLAAAETARRHAETTATAAQREAGVQAALAKSYADQLAALGDLPQQLRAALDRADRPATPRRRRSPPSKP